MKILSSPAIRNSVWLTVPFNFVAAGALGLPDSVLGRLVALPPTNSLYATFVGFLVALFGAAYIWIALQKTIPKPQLCFGAIGKIGVFLIVTVFFIRGQASWRLWAASSGDLVLGSYWLAWIVRERT